MPWFQLRRRSDRHGNRQLNAALAELPPWLSAPYLLSGRKHRRRRQVETLRSRLEASADRGSPRREIVWNTFGRARLGIWRTVSASTELQTQVGKTGQGESADSRFSARYSRRCSRCASPKGSSDAHRSRVPLWAAALSVAVLAVEFARSRVSYPRGSRPDDEERNLDVISAEPGRAGGRGPLPKCRPLAGKISCSASGRTSGRIASSSSPPDRRSTP